ncbi:MAG TPA: hypothetical protein EYG92_07125 [Lutibacter sp.]|nr:hypothetical protein [Lutibacter sp.]
MDFSQYTGFLLFMFIFTVGFWLLIFALTFIVPYWLVGSWIDRFKENRENKVKAKEETVTEESVL